MNILRRILQNKKKELALSKNQISLERMKKAAMARRTKKFSFQIALKSASMAVIAEIKRKSPSRGVIRRNFDPRRIAKQYQRGGAKALSVLTDAKFFGESLETLKQVRTACVLPILRKDFVIDPYQVYESKAAGADAILLIAAALSRKKLQVLSRLAKRLGMDVLFEVHDKNDLRKILPLKPRLIGVNNRDLKTFHVSLDVSRKLAKDIPRYALFVSESGIRSTQDLKDLWSLGVRAVLVGESLMREKDPGAALKRLLGVGLGSR